MVERDKRLIWILSCIGVSVIIWGLLIAFGMWASSQ